MDSKKDTLETERSRTGRLLGFDEGGAEGKLGDLDRIPGLSDVNPSLFSSECFGK